MEQFGGNDIDTVHWQKFVGNCGLRIFLKNGTLHRFGGFKEGVSVTKHNARIVVKINDAHYKLTFLF